MNYFDTSALVKRFVTEKGSEQVEELLAVGERAAISKIGYVEIYSALTRRRRDGDITTRAYAQACRSFENDWKTLVRVDLRDEVLELARDLIRRRPLRGFDAIHLASALALSRELGEPIRFIASDARLLDAAGSEKLQVLNPEG